MKLTQNFSNDLNAEQTNNELDGFEELVEWFKGKVYAGRWGDAKATLNKVRERLEAEGYACAVSDKKKEKIKIQISSSNIDYRRAAVYYSLEAYKKNAAGEPAKTTPRVELNLYKFNDGDLKACASATTLALNLVLRLILASVLCACGSLLPPLMWGAAIVSGLCAFQTLREYFLSRKLFRLAQKALNEIQAERTSKKSWWGWRQASV